MIGVVLLLLMFIILWIIYCPYLDIIETIDGTTAYLWYNSYQDGECQRAYIKLFEL